MRHNETLTQLKARAETVGGRVDRGLDFLQDLKRRSGQDSPEYCRYFSEWEKLLNEEKTLLDQIEIVEINALCQTEFSAI